MAGCWMLDAVPQPALHCIAMILPRRDSSVVYAPVLTKQRVLEACTLALRRNGYGSQDPCRLKAPYLGRDTCEMPVWETER